MVDSSGLAQRTLAYETARSDVQAHVPRDATRILDLGCSTGLLGAALKQRQGAMVVGVELLPAYASEAERRLDRVVVSDVERFLSTPLPSEGPFDCIIAADVLEHLVDPWTALRRGVELLRPGGTAVISVPNVAYFGALWRVIRTARWPRDPEGIFDGTHLRWFTRADAVDLMQQASINVVRIEPRFARDGRLGWLRRALARTSFERFLPRQYILSGVKRASSEHEPA
jgi:predicted TPR repeat methyltransferase